METDYAFLFSFIGLSTGIAIHWSGSRLIEEKYRKEQQRFQEVEEIGKKEQEKISILMGKEGTAHSVLKPYGMAYIDGKILEVKSLCGLIPEKTKIIVKKVELGKLIVDIV